MPSFHRALHLIFVEEKQGSKLVVAKVQSATDLRLFSPKMFDLGAIFFLSFFKLIFAWRSKSLISFSEINLCLKGFSLDT